MRSERVHWPLIWTSLPAAGVSPVSLFDLAEIRCAVDTNRLAVGLAPVRWSGRSEADPTFAAGVTPVRAIHFNQLREAIGELYEAAGLGSVPQFGQGPVAAGARIVKLSDVLDTRTWVERYESARPQLATRVARVYDSYTERSLDARYAYGKLTEMWDGAGRNRYFYDDSGNLAREVRVLDGQEYLLGYEYDEQQRLVAITFPNGKRAEWRDNPLLKMPELMPSEGTSMVLRPSSALSGEDLIAETIRRDGDGPVRRDAVGRAILLGDPARPRLRLAYDGSGLVAKRVDAQGTTHLVGHLYERHMSTDRSTADSARWYLPGRNGLRWSLERGVAGTNAASVQPLDTRMDWRMPEEVWQRAKVAFGGDARGGASKGDRNVLEAVLDWARHGGDWSAAQTQMRTPAPTLDQLASWRQLGIFDRLFDLGLPAHPALEGIDWTRLLAGR